MGGVLRRDRGLRVPRRRAQGVAAEEVRPARTGAGGCVVGRLRARHGGRVGAGQLGIRRMGRAKGETHHLHDTRRWVSLRSTHPTDYDVAALRSEEHTSELQSLMRISYAVFCLKTKQLHHSHRLERDTNVRYGTYPYCAKVNCWALGAHNN